MSKKKIIFLIFLILFFILIYIKIVENKKKTIINLPSDEKKVLVSNIIKEVDYSAQDSNGNKYNIKAKEGEIDSKNINIIYLKEIEAIIRLSDQSTIFIKSKFGQYNNLNYDTIFNEDVFMQFEENELNSENLNFSLVRGSMILSGNIKYKNYNNLLKADVIEIDLKTKDTKISMNDFNKKLVIQNIK